MPKKFLERQEDEFFCPHRRIKISLKICLADYNDANTMDLWNRFIPIKNFVPECRGCKDGERLRKNYANDKLSLHPLCHKLDNTSDIERLIAKIEAIRKAERLARKAEVEAMRLAEVEAEERKARAETKRLAEIKRLVEAEERKAKAETKRLTEAERLAEVEIKRLAEAERLAETESKTPGISNENMFRCKSIMLFLLDGKTHHAQEIELEKVSGCEKRRTSFESFFTKMKKFGFASSGKRFKKPFLYCCYSNRCPHIIEVHPKNFNDFVKFWFPNEPELLIDSSLFDQ